MEHLDFQLAFAFAYYFENLKPIIAFRIFKRDSFLENFTLIMDFDFFEVAISVTMVHSKNCFGFKELHHSN